MASAGTRVGPYEIITAIGAGGMGEVYRARDTQLNRDVAIKVLPETYRIDADRLARLRREAQLLASLNHLNIAAIYGLEQSNGVLALVLELVEGPTLADRLETGPISVDEALPIARQIAAALEAAHDNGIIHRDLKPANIKLRADGTVKVLDFGLAKSLEPAGLPTALTDSPTALSPAPTLVGVILGTAAYMSPEQARGKVVDKRADIWAFGCVLYEMLTGHKPFEGETLTDIVAAVLKNEPDWRALPEGTPRRVQSLIARCLKKDPAQRSRDIGDVRFEIEDVLQEHGAPTAVVSRARNYRKWSAWIAAVFCLGVALFLASRWSRPSSLGGRVAFPVFPPDKTVFSPSFNSTASIPDFALSPDGHALAFGAESPGGTAMLWVRSMDRVDARQLAGTEGAHSPMWSPDSRSIAFVVDQTLKRVPAAGGDAQVITQSATDFHGGTWATQDTILFSSGSGPILRVDAAGGTPTPVTTIEAGRHEAMHRKPDALPDGRHFLYFIGGQQDQDGVYAGSLDGTRKLLAHTTATAVYASPGYLLFVDGDRLMAQGLDIESLEIRGHPFAVAEHVSRNTTFTSAVSASRTGAIAYAGILDQNGRLTWMDREGHPLGGPVMSGGDYADFRSEGDYADFRLSPDGARLAVSKFNDKKSAVEIWVVDLARGSTSRVAFGGPVNASPMWSPKGTHLIFRTNRNGFVEFFQRSADGGGSDRRILDGEQYVTSQVTANNLVPTDWSVDGRIVFSAPAPASGNDLWLLPLTGDAKAAAFIASPGDQMHGNFSPDGRLIAYTSNESGRFEVYVETIPRSDWKRTVSTNGGYEPRWRADGREIYYLSEDRKLMAVAVGDGPSFGVPKALFQTRVAAGVTANRTHYVPSSDGQRFLVNMAADAVVSPITVVLNWTATLTK